MIAKMLRADSEQEMAAALPWLRTNDALAARWKIAGPGFNFAVLPAIPLTRAVINEETMEIVTPAVIDTRFHANLEIDEGADFIIPDWLVISPAPATPYAKFSEDI